VSAGPQEFTAFGRLSRRIARVGGIYGAEARHGVLPTDQPTQLESERMALAAAGAKQTERDCWIATTKNLISAADAAQAIDTTAPGERADAYGLRTSMHRHEKNALRTLLRLMGVET